MKIIIIILSVLAVLFIGGEFTQSGMEWYQTLQFPPGTPKGSVISFVWLVIFTLIAVCLIRICKARPKYFKSIIALFIINGVLNMAWSYFFFTKQMMLVAFFDLCLLWITICALIWLIRKSSHLNAYLLVPYGLWVVYAGYLNLAFWVLNA